MSLPLFKHKAALYTASSYDLVEYKVVTLPERDHNLVQREDGLVGFLLFDQWELEHESHLLTSDRLDPYTFLIGAIWVTEEYIQHMPPDPIFKRIRMLLRQGKRVAKIQSAYVVIDPDQVTILDYTFNGHTYSNVDPSGSPVEAD